MKTRSISRKSQCLRGVGVLLLVAALMVGMVGCAADPEPDPDPAQYSLTISSSEGGVVTAPGEDTFTFEEGAVVSLVAEADEGYEFVSWSGDVGSVADPEAAETTITMNGNYSITADFQAVSDVVAVCDWYDLDGVRDDLAGHYVLMNDLDSTSPGYEELASATANEGRGWEPIGAYNHSDPGIGFTGHLDGNGYEIKDLIIDRPDEDGVGLFGFVGEGGTIEDIGVIDSDVRGNDNVGGLTGVNWGTLQSCYSSGSISGELRVGGLVGRNEGGTVTHCYSSATVAGKQAIAGLVGQNLHDGTVSDSYSSATVIGGWQYIAGLVGSNYLATISNSHYSYDDVLISGQNMITTGALLKKDFEKWLANDRFLDVDERLSQEDGYYLINSVSDFRQLLAFGQDSSLKFKLQNDLDLSDHPNFFIPYLAGEFNGSGHKIWNLSFNIDFVSQVGLFGYVAIGGSVTRLGAENVDITGARSVGGLAGVNDGTVSDCYSTGALRNGRQVGGLVGGNGGTVTNSYSTAMVNGFHLVGGLVGGNVAIVTHSYSTGSVSGQWNVGGLVGSNGRGNGRDYANVSNSYARGTVTGHEYVGGLVGSNHHGGGVSNSYSTGGVTGTLSVGGLVGWSDGTVSNSFWDVAISGMQESDGGTGKTTEEMMSIVTFTDIAAEGLDEPWDMIGVASGETNPAYTWNIVDGQTYPFLDWESVG